MKAIFFAGECILAKIPRGGSLTDTNERKLNAGELVSGIVHIRCDRKGPLQPVKSSQCVNGAWFPPIPDCTCAPLSNTTVSMVCTNNDGVNASCAEPLPGTTATVSCPSNYFNSQQTIKCDGNGHWTTVKPWKPCHYHCGDYGGGIPRWYIILRRKNDNKNLCHATILNRAYAITRVDCVEGYAANEIILWKYGSVNPVQSIEYAGKYKLIRTKHRIRLFKDKMPLCLDDGEVVLKEDFAWSRDPISRCNVDRVGADGSYVGGSCPVDDAECIYSNGSGFFRESEYEIEGIKRRFLYGIGHRVERKGENHDGVYECDYSKLELFTKKDLNELDFSQFQMASGPITVNVPSSVPTWQLSVRTQGNVLNSRSFH